MPLPDRVRLPFAFDADLLVRNLASATASCGWIEHFVKQNYEGEWSVIPLRSPEGGFSSRTLTSGGLLAMTKLLFSR